MCFCSRIAWKMLPSVRKSTGGTGACGGSRSSGISSVAISLRSPMPSMPYASHTSAFSSRPGSGVRRIHRLRRDERKDVAHVVLAYPRLLFRIELLVRRDPHAEAAQVGDDLLEDRDLALLERGDQLEAIDDLLLRRPAVGRDRVQL